MKTSYSKKSFVPFSQVFLVINNKVLLLKRKSDKKMWPGKLLGVGGKIEPHEDLFHGAQREFHEETGAKLENISLKGTFSWEDESELSGINFIFTSTKYSGKIQHQSDEGELLWMNINDALKSDILAPHIPLYLNEILFGKNLYVSHSKFTEHFNTGDIGDHQSSIEYFDKKLRNVKNK